MRIDKYLAIRIGENTRSMAEWVIKNPVLLAGEFGIESDTLRMKIGDGSTPWNQLEYLQSAGSLYIAGQGITIAADGTINTQLAYEVM